MRDAPEKGPSSPQSVWQGLSWGVFLGTSWTWCIGMFLPVLLVRDLGPWAWVVFAVPNVVGAAAMGWLLARPGASEEMVRKHRAACVAFSLVTICFHVFFAIWVTTKLMHFGGLLITAFLPVVFIRARLSDVATRRLATVVYLVSLVCVALFLTRTGPSLPPVEVRLANAPMLLVGLAAVCLFGFGLCPYLDLTFHRARQKTDASNSKIAFGMGFGVFFCAMIVFTLAYSGHMAGLLAGRSLGVMGTILGVHVATQSSFTIAAHAREVLAVHVPRRFMMPFAFVVVAAVIASALLAVLGETGYLFFMSFYGLLFPAYAFAAMLPRSRPNWVVLAVAIVAAAPMYYVGFLHRQMLWLIPGVAVAMLARPVSQLLSRRLGQVRAGAGAGEPHAS